MSISLLKSLQEAVLKLFEWPYSKIKGMMGKTGIAARICKTGKNVGIPKREIMKDRYSKKSKMVNNRKSMISQKGKDMDSTEGHIKVRDFRKGTTGHGKIQQGKSQTGKHKER